MFAKIFMPGEHMFIEDARSFKMILKKVALNYPEANHWKAQIYLSKNKVETYDCTRNLDGSIYVRGFNSRHFPKPEWSYKEKQAQKQAQNNQEVS